MSGLDWLKVGGLVVTFVTAVYAAFRSGRSSDRAAAAAERSSVQQSNAAASAAESSAYTRGQDIINAAVEAQRGVYDGVLNSLKTQMADMQVRLDTQGHQIEVLQKARRDDRRTYQQAVRIYTDLLRANKIEHPDPPEFSSDDV